MLVAGVDAIAVAAVATDVAAIVSASPDFALLLVALL